MSRRKVGTIVLLDSLHWVPPEARGLVLVPPRGEVEQIFPNVTPRGGAKRKKP